MTYHAFMGGGGLGNGAWTTTQHFDEQSTAKTIAESRRAG